VVVDDFDIRGSQAGPTKTDAPLIIDSDELTIKGLISYNAKRHITQGVIASCFGENPCDKSFGGDRM
jgi:hypothetical protein